MNHVEKLYNLIGNDAVLIPVQYGTKKPVDKGWSATTVEESKEPKYQERLKKGNIGVLLGKPSNGLVSIDCDSDEAAKEFAKLNKHLHETLVTKGRRGYNLWCKIEGDYPKQTKLGDWGEFRSIGGQTVIHGKHPEGMHYKIVSGKPVMTIRFEDIVWPDKLKQYFATTPLSTNSTKELKNCNTKYYKSKNCNSVPLYDIADKPDFNKATQFIKDAGKCQENYDKWKSTCNPDFGKLFDKHFYRYYEPTEGTRNATIVKSGSRLVFIVSEEIALNILMTFYDIFQPIFHDSREDHQRESEHILKSTIESYSKNLPREEQELYAVMEAKYQTTFRILQDLASLDEMSCPRGLVHMSCNQLSLRLGGKDDKAAHRILKQFENLKIITVQTKGRVWIKGERPIATSYKWNCSLKALPEHKQSDEVDE